MPRLCYLPLVSVLLLTAGCKIEITASGGGDVETASGEYFCPSGKTCVVDVSDTFFDQEFIATPKDGQVFVAWKSLDRGFCGGRTEPCRLSTAGFVGNEILMSILSSDDRYYLEPLFAQPDTYASLAEMPIGGAVRASCTVKGKVYVFGGGWETGSPLDTTQEYDPLTDAWRRRANMPTPRAWATATALNGECYVIGGGGAGGGGKIESVVEVYNPRSNSWRSVANLPVERFSAASVTVDNRIYVIGGSSGVLSSFSPAESSVFVYHPGRDRWSRRTDMPTARRRLATGVLDGGIYAVGGGDRIGGFESSDIVERYDPVTDEWEQLDPAPTAFTSAAMTAVGDYLYLFGGFAPQPLTRSYRYQPAAGLWHRIADLETPRGDAIAETISGQIIIAGGRAPDHNGTPPVRHRTVYTTVVPS